MNKEILLRMNEDGVFEEYKEPYTTVECPTKEDYDYLEKAVEYYKNHQWISVKDRLPEQCGMGCLLCGTNRYNQQKVFEGFTGYMEAGKFQWHTNLKGIDLNVWVVTHWMPMPDPPEEK